MICSMQAVLRFACHVGLKKPMAEIVEVRRAVHLLLGLALLPPNKADQGLKVK